MLCNAPLGIARLHFAEIAVIVDKVADSAFLDVARAHFVARDLLGPAKRFHNGVRIVFATAKIMDFGDAQGLLEFVHETRDIFSVDIVRTGFAL